MKKLLSFLSLFTVSLVGYGQITQTTKLVAGTNISLNQAGNTYTVSAISSGTLAVSNGGTGKGSFTPYAVITGGTTSTGALQNVSGLGTSGQVLTSAGAGALPSWTTLSSGLTVGTTAIASGTVGALLFEGAGNVLQEDATQLFWDNTNNRLGIGTSSPTESLSIAGNIAPTTNNTRDLGTTTEGWANLYMGSNIHYTTDLLFKTSATTKMTLTTGGDLGVGTTPFANTRVSIKSSFSGTDTYSLKIQNNALTELFNVRDDGYLSIPAGGIPGFVAPLTVGTSGSSGGAIAIYSTKSNSIMDAGAFAPGDLIGGGGAWGLRTGTANDFFLDMGVGFAYPSFAHNALKIEQKGLVTFTRINNAVNYKFVSGSENPALKFVNAFGLQWDGGIVAVQREYIFEAPIYQRSDGGAVTLTNASTFFVEGAPIGDNTVTITNSHALNVGSVDVTTNAYDVVTNSYGLTVNAQTGATNNYAAQFLGGTVNFYGGVGTGVELHAISTPTTGATITLAKNKYTAIDPAGTIATLTITFPDSPADNDFVEVKFTQIATTVTYVAGTGGATIKSQINGVLGGYSKWVYDTGTNTWY